MSTLLKAKDDLFVIEHIKNIPNTETVAVSINRLPRINIVAYNVLEKPFSLYLTKEDKFLLLGIKYFNNIKGDKILYSKCFHKGIISYICSGYLEEVWYVV